MVEPLSGADAKRLAAAILDVGALSFSRHKRDEMRKDNLNAQDAINTLRGGVCEFCEQINDSWRYRFRTSRMYFVIAFRSETEAVVVTAWRP